MGKGYEETVDKEVWVPGNTYPPVGLSGDGEGEQSGRHQLSSFRAAKVKI